MIFRRLTLAFALSFIGVSAMAADLIQKTSPHTVSVTIDRLSAAVEAAGAKVFARVDHAAGAQRVGADLRPTEMLMFGNPKLGTPAIKAAQTSGLDLPLRVLAYKDADGVVHVTYHDPAELAGVHGMPADAEVLAKMTGALGKLTDKAIAAE
jgi:uncharacterized protein (DUF302 family)